jgi:hypothetical protein
VASAWVSLHGPYLAAESRGLLKGLVQMLAERIMSKQRAVASVEIVPAALPFFAPQPTLLLAPPDGLGNSSTTDPLVWYITA